MTPRRSLSMGAYSERESDVIGRLMCEHELLEPMAKALMVTVPTLLR